MSPPGPQKTFLDLNITLKKDNKIHTSTYHKPLNLHLYIPPTSAHPPGVLFGLIAGSIRRFWLQNTTDEDFKSNVAFIFQKLRERGHDPDHLRELFAKASDLYVHRNGNVKRFITTKTTSNNTRTMYFHQEYHPRGIARRDIQAVWRHTIGILPYYDRQVICYSRPKI